MNLLLNDKPRRRMTSAGIITTGLVAAWNFLGTGIGQTIDGAHGTAIPARLGATTGVDADDPAPGATGLVTSGAGNIYSTGTFDDTGLLDEMTLIVVAKLTTGQWICGKHAGNGISVNPFSLDISGGLLRAIRGNAGGFTAYSGPSNDDTQIQFYAVVFPSVLESAPTFFKGSSKSTGSGKIGSGTGAATGSNAAFKFGSRPDGVGDLGSGSIISYALIYDAALSDADISRNYSALSTIMADVGVTLP